MSNGSVRSNTAIQTQQGTASDSVRPQIFRERSSLVADNDALPNSNKNQTRPLRNVTAKEQSL